MTIKHVNNALVNFGGKFLFVLHIPICSSRSADHYENINFNFNLVEV